jgi:hypothetical protein
MFEELVRVTQLVNKYLAFYIKQEIHYLVHKSPQLDHILSQINPVFVVITWAYNIYLKSILILSFQLSLELFKSFLFPSEQSSILLLAIASAVILGFASRSEQMIIILFFPTLFTCFEMGTALGREEGLVFL